MSAATDATAATTERDNVFIVSLDEFNLQELRGIPRADERYAFHPLLTYDEVGRESEEGVNIAYLLGECRRRLLAFPDPEIFPDTEGCTESVDAVTSFWDFPISEMVPMICEEQGVPGPTLTSVLKCNHKYWSRVEQKQCVPEVVPEFRAVDVFDDDAVATLDLPYPFWIKPVRAYSSHLGFRINRKADLVAAIAEIRDKLPRLGDPFTGILERADLPEEVLAVGGQHCIAESIIGGRQCTLEGWVHRGEVHVYGVVDSIRQPNGSSFSRYQYPSTLPRGVQARMEDVAARFIKQIGYDDAAFNMEFFWQRNKDRIHLVEMNSRCSQSHADLFAKVDGSPNLQVAVEVALGRRPDFPHREGDFRCAGKFFLRYPGDALVTRAPTEEELAAVHERFPHASIVLDVAEGSRLADLVDQDSYSYELGHVFLAASSERELLDQYDKICRALPFELAPLAPARSWLGDTLKPGDPVF